VIDEAARRAGVSCDRESLGALVAKTHEPVPMLLVKPLTFVNLSGQAIRALADYHKVEMADLLVIADDVNLPLGRLRARAGGSAGGHNGFKSVAQHLGTDQFPRLRVGVGRGDQRRDLPDHVLARFDPDERPAIDEAIDRAADAIEVFARAGIAGVMNRFNAGPKELSETADDEKDSQS
jgi:peptidyl-tRNA hydrolase, PTH1 family